MSLASVRRCRGRRRSLTGPLASCGGSADTFRCSARDAEPGEVRRNDVGRALSPIMQSHGQIAAVAATPCAVVAGCNRLLVPGNTRRSLSAAGGALTNGATAWPGFPGYPTKGRARNFDVAVFLGADCPKSGSNES